jgi:predicted ester cyclase
MATDETTSRERIHEFAQSIRGATSGTITDEVHARYADDAAWHGTEPHAAVTGPDAIVAEFWAPLLEAFPDLQRNDYLLFAGESGGEEWVCASGNLVGTFDRTWLDIPPTGDATWIRFGEFHRMEDGLIAETYLFVDTLDVLRQAGYRFVPSLGPEVVVPGPATQDGVQFDPSGTAESARTLGLVKEMIFDGLLPYEKERFAGYWTEDFTWYGPCGIGTTRGIDGFHEAHQRPFEEAFSGWDGATGNHICRFADGNYCGWLGWPDIEATHTGSGWLGLPATGTDVSMRVMDIWRREGDLLAENWVFIDMIDLLEQIGVDVFDRLVNHPESVEQ